MMGFMLLVPLLLYIFLWLLACSLIQDKINHETTETAIAKIRSEMERSQTLN